MMKRILFAAILLFVLSPAISNAQVMGGFEPFMEAGVKIGGDFQHLSGPVKTGPAVILGGYARKSLERFGARIEVMGTYGSYTTKYPAAYYMIHTPTMDTISKGKFQAIGLYVPLMVEYLLKEKLRIIGGPQFRYLVSLSDQNGAFTKLYGKNSFLKSTDFSIVAGVEYTVKRKINLGARIMKGVTDINNSTYYLVPRTWSTLGAQVSISYKIM